jgi:hypothetical protein
VRKILTEKIEEPELHDTANGRCDEIDLSPPMLSSLSTRWIEALEMAIERGMEKRSLLTSSNERERNDVYSHLLNAVHFFQDLLDFFHHLLFLDRRGINSHRNQAFFRKCL